MVDQIYSVEKIVEKFKHFLNKLNQGRKETKDAWGIVVKSIKEKRKLTIEEKKIVGKQLGDSLKTTGLTISFFLPGGIVYLLLTRVSRFKKYLLPSILSNDSDDSDEFKQQ